MTTTELTNKTDTAATYDAAAKDFDAVPFAFWDRHGRRTVERMALRLGSRVLDVGCGTGASAIPAAVDVGPEGHVTAVDISDGMLHQARRKAAAARLDNISFEKADMTALPFDEAEFDAVISVFSLFFVEDMVTTLNALWRMVRPGGVLGLTVWAPDAMSPGAGIFLEEIGRLRPDLPEPACSRHRLVQIDAIEALFREAIGRQPEIHLEPFRPTVSDPDDWWALIRGTGYRRFVQQLTPGERDEVRDRLRRRLREAHLETAELGAIISVARKL